MATPKAIEEKLQDRITKLEEQLPQILPLLEAVRSLKEELEIKKSVSSVPEAQKVDEDGSLKTIKENASATQDNHGTLEENLAELKRKIETGAKTKLTNNTELKNQTQELKLECKPQHAEQKNLEMQLLESKEKHVIELLAEQTERMDLQKLKNKMELELLREQAQKRSLEEQVKALKHELETKLNIEHSQNRLQEEVRALKQTHEFQLNEEVMQRRSLENKVQILTQNYDSERSKHSTLETQIQDLNQKLREQNEKQKIQVSTQLVSCPTVSSLPMPMSPFEGMSYGSPSRNISSGRSSSICGAACRDGHACRRRTSGGTCFQH